MSSSYTVSFACLECCKSFKRDSELSKGIPNELPCPNCGNVSYNLGRHFKAPKQSDKKQWDKIRFLVSHGFRFQKIRPHRDNNDSVPYPIDLAGAREFVERYKEFSLNIGDAT